MHNLHLIYINICVLRNLGKNKDIIITKPDKKMELSSQITKMNKINCILLVLLLLVSMVLLKCTNVPLVIHFLNFCQLFHLQALLIIVLPVFFAIFFPLQYLMVTRAKILLLFFLKLRMQVFLENFLFSKIQLVILLIFHFKKPFTQQ